MRRSIASSTILLLAVSGLLTPSAVASPLVPGDDPEPPVLGPPPTYSGVDLSVRRAGSEKYVGAGTNSLLAIAQFATRTHPRVRAMFRVCGRHADVGRVVLSGSRGGLRFHVRYRTPSGKDVTDAIVRGRYVTRSLSEGECSRIRMTVRRTAAAHRGDTHRFTMAGHEVGHPNRLDHVASIVHAGPAYGPLRSASVTPPPGFHGTDLVITSVRSFAGLCSSGKDEPLQSQPCRAGRFERGDGQSIVQLIGDLEGYQAVARVAVWNFQPHARRITLKAAGSTRGYRVRYVSRHHDITSRIVAGTYRTPRIGPGERLRIRVVVTTRNFVRNGKLTGFFVRAKRKTVTTSTGVERVIPGDVVTGYVESWPFDVPPAIPLPTP